MKQITSIKAVPALLTLTAALMAGCGKSSATGGSSGSTTPDGPNSPSAVAAGVAGGAAAQGSGQNVGSYKATTPFEKFRRLLSLESEALASTACPTYASPQGATCGGAGNQTMALTYSSCSFGSSAAVWQGGQSLTFGGSAVCGTTNLPIENNGDTLQRTFVGTIPGLNPTTRTSSDGIIVELDSTTATGYSQSVSGGELIQGNGSGHTITVQGLHLVRAGFWDHSVSTVSGQPLLVVNPGANREIQSGTLMLQHNLARYIATSVFTDVQFSGTSCFPQSGTITTTFSGSRTGSETLVFNGGGSATLTDGTTGLSATFTITHCF